MSTTYSTCHYSANQVYFLVLLSKIQYFFSICTYYTLEFIMYLVFSDSNQNIPYFFLKQIL